MGLVSERNDIHRPSALDPVEYEPIGSFYQGGSDEMHEVYEDDHRDLVRIFKTDDWHEVIGVPDGNFRGKGSCDHCGARFAHGVIYKHSGGDLLVVGHICAHNALLPGLTKLDREKALKDKAAKALKAEAANKAYRAETLAANPALADAFEIEGNPFIADVRRRFNGSKPELSEKQIAAVVRVAAEDRARKAERADEVKVPCPVGKGIAIEGEVIKVAEKEGFYGVEIKMTVKDDRGFLVWGTRPESLSGHWGSDDEGMLWLPGAEKGARVRFVANIEDVSDKDESFGFFKRPRKAELLARAHEDLDEGDFRKLLSVLLVDMGADPKEVNIGLLDPDGSLGLAEAVAGAIVGAA